jgi:hypothetical protein
MHGSRSKIPSKIFRQERCAEGFNSGVKGLKWTIIKILGVKLFSLFGVITDAVIW